MKKLLVLHTGGTIAMQQTKEGGVALENANPLLSASFSLPKGIQLVVEEIFNFPSPHITLTQMLQLKERISQGIREENIQGVVITHGTDTLEETAFFLDRTLNVEIPIILTGAMRSSDELGTDGLHNYLTALRVANQEESKEKGVLVVMNDEIHTARFVTKTHTTNVATFRTPTYGPIGLVNKKEVIYSLCLKKQKVVEISSVNGNVPIIKAYAGMGGEIFQTLSRENIDGIVVEALGAGNLPPATVPELKRLLAEQVPIVLVSRCFNGVAEPVYSYDGGGVQLEKMGILFSQGVNSQKARIQLLIGLNANFSQDELKKYICGK